MNENETGTGTHTKLGSFDELSNQERMRLARTINEAGLTWHASAYLEDDSEEVALTIVDEGSGRS